MTTSAGLKSSESAGEAARRLSWSARVRAALPIALLLSLQLGLSVASVRKETATYDESDHLRYGMQVLDGRTERFDDSKMPVSALNAAAARLFGKTDPKDLATLRVARLATIGAGLGLTLVTFLWARALHGRAAGLLAGGIAALDPSLIAHSRLVTTDVWGALGITLALASSWAWSRRPGYGRAVAAGLAIGAAQLCKFTSVVLYPLLALVAVVRFVARRRLAPEERTDGLLRTDPRATAGQVAAALVASLVVLNAGYLFQGTGASLSSYRFRSGDAQAVQAGAGVLGRLPLPVPRAWLEGLDWVREYERTGKNYGKIYLLGKLRSGEGFPGYFVVVGLFKMPVGTQLLLLATAISLLRRAREPRLWQDEVFLVVPLVFFALYFNFLFRAQIGFRFVLVCVPLAYVLAGSLLRRGWDETSRALRAFVACAAAATAISVLAFYPYYISYVNELLADRNRAFRVFADSSLDYGQSDGYFAAFRAAHPDVIFEPKAPVAGTIAARVNWLAGISEELHDTWLAKNFEPTGHVARSYLVFHVTEEEAARLRAELRPPGEAVGSEGQVGPPAPRAGGEHR